MKQIIIGNLECLADQALTLTSISEELLLFFGCSRDEIEAQYQNSFFAMTAPQDRCRLRDELMHGLSGTDILVTVEFKITVKEKSPVHVCGRWRLSSNESGRYCCELTLAEDSNADYYRAILDVMQEPLILLDQNLKIEFMNRAMQRTTGCTIDDSIGEYCKIFQTPSCGTDQCCFQCYLRGDKSPLQFTSDGHVMRAQFTPVYDQRRLSVRTEDLCHFEPDICLW